MVRTTLQLEELAALLPESWPRKRLEAAVARAERDNSEASWRTLRNLAAAYGCADLARQAHEGVAPHARATRRIAPATMPATSQIGGMTTVALKINSPTPRARTAWLKKWCQSRGCRIETRGKHLVECTSSYDGDRLMSLLGWHPEIACAGQQS